jgi:hypothetical protein
VAPAFVHEVLASPGQPLDPATRGFMESRFGRDFSRVRVHADARAAEAAEAVGSHAFTVGRQIVFGPGRYAPHTGEGARLLGHELTHTVQQAGAASSGDPLRIEPPGTGFERAAEERGARLGSGAAASAPVAPLGAVALQRQPKTDEPESLFTIFVADPAKSRDRRFARREAAADAARIREAGTLSRDERQLVNAKLRFFEGDAWDVYRRGIRPALVEVTTEEIEMPAEPARDVAGSGQAELPPGVGTHDEFFKRMLAHENYVDNDIRTVEYFFGEMARIHYRDGSTFDLWLSPVRAPFAEIDFHTPREDFRPVFDAKGNVGFLREADLANVPRSMPIAEVFKTYARPVQFVVGPDLGGRIVPTRLNMLTAPTLCGVLLDSERRYEEQVGIAVQLALGGIRAIGPYAGAGGIPKPLGGLGTATVSRVALSMEARSLAREMDALLASGGTRTLTVKEVQLVGVQVSRQGKVLTVRRFMSNLPEHLRGKGTGMEVAAAFEQAAAEVGRINGAKKVLIDVGIIINPGWRKVLEARGYVHILEEGRWVKTIEL